MTVDELIKITKADSIVASRNAAVKAESDFLAALLPFDILLRELKKDQSVTIEKCSFEYDHPEVFIKDKDVPYFDRILIEFDHLESKKIRVKLMKQIDEGSEKMCYLLEDSFTIPEMGKNDGSLTTYDIYKVISKYTSEKRQK